MGTLPLTFCQGVSSKSSIPARRNEEYTGEWLEERIVSTVPVTCASSNVLYCGMVHKILSVYEGGCSFALFPYVIEPPLGAEAAIDLGSYNLSRSYVGVNTSSMLLV